MPNNSGKRTARTGVILDEIGLGPLARALTAEVLAPFARLLHEGWAPWSIDSYHAFSIHVKGNDTPWRFEAADDDEAPARGSADEPDGASPSTPDRRDVGDRLPLHNDICESSMNICLGSPGRRARTLHPARALVPHWCHPSSRGRPAPAATPEDCPPPLAALRVF